MELIFFDHALWHCLPTSPCRKPERPRVKSRRTAKTEKPPGHSCAPAASQIYLSNFLLAHSKCIERRLVDRLCLGEPLVGLVGGERLAGQRPEQSIHVTPVIPHLL